MRKIVFLLLIFFVHFCDGQVKNSGRISDEKGKAVAGATVHILNSDIFILSDDAGRFTIPDLPKGIYMLEISSIGFASVEKKTNTVTRSTPTMPFRAVSGTT